MKVVGIIAEFNPFHEGHAYLIRQAKEQCHADHIIVCMSNYYVQRGEPAIIPPNERVRAALSHDVDLVLALPACVSLSSAQGFARGAVATLLATGVVDEIVFGTEGRIDREELVSLAEYLNNEPDDYQLALKQYLKQGFSYPKARQRALMDCYQMPLSPFYETANNILALEYVRALKHFKSDVSFSYIPRIKGISAHSIRRTLMENQNEGIEKDDFSALFHFRFLTDSSFLETKAVAAASLNEDLARTISRVLTPQDTLTTLADKCHGKQLTYSHVMRALFCYLLALPPLKNAGQVAAYAPYLRILGFQKSDPAVLRAMESNASVPVLKKLSKDISQLSEDARLFLEQDLKAADFYRLIANRKYPDWDLKNEPSTGMLFV